MIPSRSVVASGLVALLVAFSVIALISLSGVPPIRLLSASSNNSQGPASGTTSTGPNPTTGPSVTSQSPGGKGVLSLLMSDPPHVPPGVTSVSVYYNNLAVHGVSGWITLKSSGVIDVLGTVNSGETLASATVPGGSYDIVEFDISSALITYNGVNYPAFVQGGQLNVKMDSDAVVTSSQPAAALIDISPTVVNVGSTTVPKFVLWSEARAFPVPSDQVNAGMAVEGNKMSLSGLVWWESDRAADNASLKISSVSLKANSLGLTVSDVGSQGTFLKLVVISGISPLAGAGGAAPTADMTGCAVFVVESNGSLVQFIPVSKMGPLHMSGENQSSVFDALYRAGYNLSAGGSVHLTYAGPIELSFGIMVSPSGIVSGSTFWVTVIGDDTVATTQVSAT